MDSRRNKKRARTGYGGITDSDPSSPEVRGLLQELYDAVLDTITIVLVNTYKHLYLFADNIVGNLAVKS